MIPVDWTIPYEERSWIHRLDPRGRIVATLTLSTAVVFTDRPAIVVASLIAGTLLIAAARYSAQQMMYRLSALMLFCIVLTAFMPLAPGTGPGFSITYSRELFQSAIMISGKSCAVMLFVISFIGTIEPTSLGHALVHLHVPRTLVQLYLFTIRYFDVLRREMQVMHTAMLARGFRPSVSRHTLKSYGYLVGMLLIRSLDRSERILKAMKCRGYQGKFFLYHHFHFKPRDAWFVTAALAASMAAVGWKYLL